MANDDDFLESSVPDPDAEPTAAERAHAKTFAELVDKTLSGRTPPAVSADDRALLEVATVIRATSGGLELSGSKQRSLVEDALRQAVGQNPATSLSTTPISEARAKRRWLPWAIAATSTAVAAAAVLMLWLRKPTVIERSVVETPATWKSRPADSLIGPIAAERAGDAGARMDTIFADRLDGYRDRMLSPRGGRR